MIEGIGPKISDVLKKAGVATFGEMGTMTAEQVRIKMTTIDPSLGVHNPTTWPEQARLAAAGDWDRLRAWQDELHGGIDLSLQGGGGQSESPAPAGAVTEMDDLTKIEGIGPKICQVLQSAGIRTFADLAGHTPEKVRETMMGVDPSLGVHNPMTWPDQAKLARDGQWDELKILQDRLDGGL